MKKKQESSSVIHVTIRSSKNIRPTRKRSINLSQKSDPILSMHKTQQSPQRKPCFSSSSKIYPSDRFPVQSAKHTWSDRRGLTKDYHQTLKKPKKQLCSKKCALASVIIALIVSIAVTAILLGLLTKSKKSATSPTSVPTLRWNSTGITIAGLSNAAGNSSNQLNQPTDVALVDPNLLYIADYNNHRVQKYQIGSSNGVTVAGEAYGSGGTSLNQLKHPTCILVDSTGGIFVSDSDNNRVQYWSNGASMGVTVAGSSTGILGNTNSTFSDPAGLARNETSGTLYIADFGNNRVMDYLFNALSGSSAAGDGMFGTGLTQLWKPAGLYLDTFSNSLVIANHNAKNIVRWTLGGTNWTLLAGNANGISGTNATLLNYPQYVTLDPMGNMYIVDKANHRIQLFMVGQTDGITIAGVTLTPGSNSTLLNTPFAVRLDNQLNLYVADSYNHRIQKFLRY